jgi:hypothetical protein
MICSPSGRPISLSQPSILSWRRSCSSEGGGFGPLQRTSAGPSKGIVDLDIDATGAADCSGIRGE